MEQGKFDKLLKAIEDNKNSAEGKERTEVFLPDLNETIEMRKLTFQEKKTFQFSMVANENGIVDVGATLQRPEIKKLIYVCCSLAPLAVKAKEKKLINSYYDVVDYLFSGKDLYTIVNAISLENRLTSNQEIDEVKN